MTAIDQGQPLRVLPWRLVAFLVAVMATALGLTFWVGGPSHLGATVAGLTVGLVGSLMASPRTAVFATLVLLVALSVHIFLPGQIPNEIIAIAMVLLAGAEAGIGGGRAMVMALFGFLKLTLLPDDPPVPDDLPYVAGSALLGGLAVSAIGLHGKAKQAPGGLKFGFGLTLFLALGLLGMFWLIARLEQPLSYWLALLFVWRAAAPPERTMGAAVRFGAGAVLGSLFAMLATYLGLPQAVILPLTLVLIVAGFRLLPHPGPWAPAAFTSAVVLNFASGPADALFRAEVALLIVALTVFLTIVIGALWHLIASAQSEAGSSKP